MKLPPSLQKDWVYTVQGPDKTFERIFSSMRPGLMLLAPILEWLFIGRYFTENWVDYGKKNWATWGKRLHALALALVVLIIVRHFIEPIGSSSNATINMLTGNLCGLTCGLHLSLIFIPYLMQRQAFRFWQNTGDKARLHNYPYNLRLAFAGGIGLILFFVLWGGQWF